MPVQRAIIDIHRQYRASAVCSCTHPRRPCSRRFHFRAAAVFTTWHCATPTYIRTDGIDSDTTLTAEPSARSAPVCWSLARAWQSHDGPCDPSRRCLDCPRRTNPGAISPPTSQCKVTQRHTPRAMCYVRAGERLRIHRGVISCTGGRARCALCALVADVSLAV